MSKGLYASLNVGLSSGDDRKNILKNRHRVTANLEAKTLVTLSQTHSATAYVIQSKDDIEKIRGQAGDALVTTLRHIALGVLTADCAPVLFEAKGVVGAAHAGWKGAFSGILEATLTAMQECGAVLGEVRAVVGPCIAQASYEVDQDFRARFLAQEAAHAAFFIPSSRADHWLFDLKAYVRQRLARAGVSQIEVLAEDTYAQEAQFFSFRRSTHRKEPDYGRQISAICLS